MDTIDKDFWQFHADNPEIYRLFKKYAFEILRSGFEHYSAYAIIHRVRWHVDIDTKNADGYKLNDHHVSRYSRLLEKEYPGSFKGFFRHRKLKTESVFEI